MAIELGDIRLANAICLGALAKATGVTTTDDLAAALEAHLPERHRNVLPLNFEALKKGAELA